MAWTAREMPPQSGRTAVVTGADEGTGLVTARELARHGARVVLACRSTARGEAARAQLLREVPEAAVEFRALDLADLASVHAFTESLPGDRLDLLINNASVRAVPYARTVDGFETHLGVNHLGHFALTGLLLGRLLATPDARVVTVAGLLHAAANIDLTDLHATRGHHPRQAYARSQSACLLFTHELARRTTGLRFVAAAAHPGHPATGHPHHGPRLRARLRRLLAATPELGAAAVLYAATAEGVAPDSYTGPRLGVRGGPAPAWRAPWTRDDRASRLLWDASVRLTGVTPPL